MIPRQPSPNEGPKALQRLAGLVTALALLAALALPAQAQVVRGTLREAGSGAPIEGAMVVLLGTDDAPVYQVLTDASGRFFMERRSPGRYRLRADRIGHASSYHPAFTLAEADTVAVEMIATVEAIQLEGIDVEGDTRCRVRPEEGLAVATVWEEVRKALAAASWTGEHGVFRYDLTHLDRNLDRRAQRVEREDRRLERTSRQRTFISLPAGKLISEGFVVTDRDGTVFYGPDADVLLSDDFLETHCFRLRQGRRSNEGLLGLGFEPVGGRRLTEISGTLWLDPSTSELRLLEWRYVNLHPDLDNENLGGRVEFVALPSGPWIIRKWWIRMPLIGLDPRNRANSGRQLVGIRETGAQVRRIAEATGRIVMEFEGGAVQGTVRGGYQATPLSGAQVEIVGVPIEVRADRSGRFTAVGLEEGTYAVRFSHPSLDSLGFRAPDRLVEVPDQGVVELELVAPTPFEIIAAQCSDEEMSAGTAALMGFLRREDTGEPATGATLRVTWARYDVPGQGVVRETASGVRAVPDERGFYLACGVPTDTPLEVTVENGDRLPSTSLRIPAEEWRWYFDAAVPGAPVP
ncbi:MAG: carboxypeptidase-like regulatory domain-containing protein [Gemmatimonadota bacterium]